jgi:hypothetical protein
MAAYIWKQQRGSCYGRCMKDMNMTAAVRASTKKAPTRGAAKKASAPGKKVANKAPSQRAPSIDAALQQVRRRGEELTTKIDALLARLG